MAIMGKYCKAYLLGQFRMYADWHEKTENIRPKSEHLSTQANNEINESSEHEPLVEDSVLYLQENYVVTDGIFKDEYIIFDDVTPEWIDFCTQDLHFEIPDYSRSAA